jgi:type I restriction enzyme S subunit
MRRLAGGSNISNISQEILGDIPIYVPSLGEQHAVVSGLEPFDDALELITRLVGAKRRFSRGVRQQLLTGRLRLPGFRTPWTEYLLGSLFVERVELYRGNLPLLSITSERGVVPRDDLDRRDTSSVDKSRYLRIAPGDIGYNPMRMWQGVSALSGLEGIVSPAYTIVVPGPKVDGRFAAALFKFPSVVNLFRRNSQGLVDDTLTLKFHNFARIRLRFPPIEEQRAISAMFATLDAEIELLPKLLRALNRQKGALLDKLLSGELQLPTK